MSAPAKTAKMTPEIRFICAFCGALCEAGGTRRPGETAGVVHEHPACERFLVEEGPTEFMRANRLRWIELTRPTATEEEKRFVRRARAKLHRLH